MSTVSSGFGTNQHISTPAREVCYLTSPLQGEVAYHTNPLLGEAGRLTSLLHGEVGPPQLLSARDD